MSANSVPVSRLRLSFDANEAYCVVLVLAYDSVSKGDTAPKEVNNVSMALAVKKWIPMVFGTPKYACIKFGNSSQVELTEISERESGASMIKKAKDTISEVNNVLNALFKYDPTPGRYLGNQIEDALFNVKKGSHEKKEKKKFTIDTQSSRI